MLIPDNIESLQNRFYGRRRRVLILGSTGSIGTSALNLIADNPVRFEVIGLVAGGSRIDELNAQIRTFNPRWVGVGDSSNVKKISANNSELVSGIDEICSLCAQEEVDIVLAGIVGMIGLKPVLAALNADKFVALANKESLVAGGKLVAQALKNHSGALVPVDSEHSALFQVLLGEKIEDISRLILTASGGPFLNQSRSELSCITPEQAVKHPRWNMGPKISIDSATMMNKALEIIEAHWLYAINEERIHVVVHPQSIVHSLVDFCDGTQLAQLSHPDMRGPISYALGFPEGRIAGAVKSLNLEEVGRLDFMPASTVRFPALSLAKQALKSGAAMPLVLNAANEAVVQLFIEGRIVFTDIELYVEKAMEKFADSDFSEYEELRDLDSNVRVFINEIKDISSNRV